MKILSISAIGFILNLETKQGKGDLRSYLVSLGKRWQDEIAQVPVMVFDREGYGCEFFHTLLENQVCFVTGEKYIDTHNLDAFKPEMFTESFEFNAKMYRIFEGKRTFTHKLEDGSY